MPRVASALLVISLCAVAGLADDAVAPPAGRWKFVLPLQSTPRAMWLVELARKDGRWTGAVLGRAEDEPRVPAATLVGLSVSADTVRFTLRTASQLFRFEGQLPKEPGAAILGTVTTGGDVMPAQLEPTTLTRIDRLTQAREVLARQKDGVAVVKAALTLLGGAGEAKAKPEEVRGWIERALQAAGPFGPRWRRDLLLTVAELLLDQAGYEATALPYARQAERLLDEKDPVALKKRTLTVLAAALDGAGKPEESSVVQERATKLDATIQTTPFAGPRGGRVALVELFTGAQCPPCVAADAAFDALGKGFKPAEAVRLQYHLHIPGPDPLTSPDAEARKTYYSRAVEATPVFVLGGRPAAIGGGPLTYGQERYDDCAGLVDGLLEQPAGATVKATAVRKGNKVEIKADVSDLRQTGDDVRLRLALVEDEVAYTGRNKVATHHNVVRVFPGGVNGTPMLAKTGSKSATVDIDALRKELQQYLDKYAAEAEERFPGKMPAIELKKLRLVAFVQNDETGEVLQATQVDVE